MEGERAHQSSATSNVLESPLGASHPVGASFVAGNSAGHYARIKGWRESKASGLRRRKKTKAELGELARLGRGTHDCVGRAEMRKKSVELS